MFDLLLVSSNGTDRTSSYFSSVYYKGGDLVSRYRRDKSINTDPLTWVGRVVNGCLGVLVRDRVS